jgi:hypothetical protein
MVRVDAARFNDATSFMKVKCFGWLDYIMVYKLGKVYGTR